MSIWIMSPSEFKIQKTKYNFKLRSKFPNGFECKQFCINGITDYYVVFFEADDGGAYNASAKWIAPYCGVAPTGNFVVMHKKWIDEEEKTVDMAISPAEFKKKYLI